MSEIRQIEDTGRPARRTMARICREAGATVRFNTRLREMNVLGCLLHHGVQLAVDVTFRCALTCGGNAHPQAASTNGAVLTRFREDKERKYAELLESKRCQLVVVALKTGGGRWSTEATEFMDSLAAVRAREAPRILWRSAFLGCRRRWSRMLAVSCARAFAASLVALPAAALSGTDGPSPDLADLFAM